MTDEGMKKLKDLRKEYEFLAKCNGGEDYITFKALDMAVKELSNSEIPNKWISVSERVPEDIDSVLVWFEYLYDDSWCEGYGLAYYADGWGWRLDSNADHPTVKAWMPLPEPYKAEREETE